MEYTSPGHLRPLYKDWRFIAVLIIAILIAATIFPNNMELAIIFSILILALWYFLYPSAEEKYELTEEGIKIIRKNKTTNIPYKDINEAIFRSFRSMPVSFISNLQIMLYSHGYSAITLKHGKKSVELAFDKEDGKKAHKFFDKIKKHIGDKAKDWRSGEIDWIKVIKYFAGTWLLIIILSALTNLGYFFAAILFMPIWIVIWFLILHSLDLFKKP